MGGEKRERDRQAEALAREAVLLVANDEQEPIATYLPGPLNELDLTGLKPGAVLRLRFARTNNPQDTQWRWFVLGSTTKENFHLYQVIHHHKKEAHLSQHETLNLGESWDLMPLKQNRTSFKVEEALSHIYALSGKKSHDTTTQQVDLIHSGRKEAEAHPNSMPNQMTIIDRSAARRIEFIN